MNYKEKAIELKEPIPVRRTFSSDFTLPKGHNGLVVGEDGESILVQFSYDNLSHLIGLNKKQVEIL